MLRVGFIGLGIVSNEHVLGYLDNPDAEIAAVCDLDREAGQRWLERWEQGQATLYDKHEEMLEKESLDIVEVLTPHHLHCALAVDCAQAGVRGLSLQKPMAHGLAECDRIIEACRRNEVKLRVYENFLFYPAFERAKALIEEGVIGEPISIRVNTMGGVKEGAPWPIFWDPTSWRMDFSRSGTGPLVGDDGFHKFSLARWFMERDFEKIGAWIDGDTPLDAPAMIRARFRDSAGKPKYAQLDFSFSPRMALPCSFWLEDFVEIFGEKGVMWINQCTGGKDRAYFQACNMSGSPAFPPIAVFVDGEVTTYMEEVPPEERSWSSSFVGATRHFVEAVRDDSRPVFSGEEGREITRYIIAAYLSAQEERDVYLDEITTQAELDREYEIKGNFCNAAAAA
ncbi:MAG: Gfo/Idh/MocA family oxidoreductase [Caldilineaceae bacterium]|nr:Gfo/Idh/MocA family oxidoreductase [Caldilineaceae bacterium]